MTETGIISVEWHAELPPEAKYFSEERAKIRQWILDALQDPHGKYLEVPCPSVRDAHHIRDNLVKARARGKVKFTQVYRVKTRLYISI